MTRDGLAANMPKLVNNFHRWWPTAVVIIFFSFWFSYFAWFWSHSISLTDTGNLMINHVNMWGDWAAHFTMGSAMGYRELWLAQSPFLLGARFSYPFLANFISACFIRIGVPFFTSFIVPSFLASCLLVASLFYFFKTLLSNKVLAVVASLIVLLNGGLGFYYFIQDVAASPEPLLAILNPTHEYTRLDSENIKWISIIDSMVIPQRAFTQGFPLALIALALIYEVTFQKPSRPKLRLVVAGSILGLLPLIHTHSFLAAGIILSFWLVASWLLQPLSKKRLKQIILNWSLVGGISLLLALPLFYFFFFNQTQGFLRWYPGWLAKEFEMNWFVFWFKNWLLTPWLGLLGFWLVIQATRNNRNRQTWVQFCIWFPFIGLFILANLFLFQPFAWDNTKLIVWSSVGIAGLSTVFLDHWWQSKKFGLKVLATAIFLVTIASGMVDAHWIIRTDLHSFQMYSAEELALAEWVKNNTPSDSIWLTGDQHNHWLFNLTGRQSVMTYRGWLWTHGYDYLPVQADVTTMFAMPRRTDLFTKYGVDYVVIGYNEQKVWGANHNDFQSAWPSIKSTPHYQIYAINGP